VMNANLKPEITSQPYHPVTRWLHAGLVLGVIFQLTCAFFMAHPKHADEGHGKAMVHAKIATEHDSKHTSVTTHTESMATKAQSAMHKDDALGQWFMSAHRTGGFLVAVIVLANLIWALVLRGTPRKRQISVLFSAFHWREARGVLKQLSLMFVGKGGMPVPGNALSLIVEMLGMLTMAAMAVSGVMIWNIWAGPGNTVVELAEAWMGVHGTLALLLFLYLTGHVSMALLHMRSGDSVFSRIRP
ncbi:MAG: cytochrome b/b6 domain-containing protein, partial [Mariprofundaceae bacterium]|nr:cytochrome b/b6 domain-containing protein [Mariprofundaceae bacterium]